MNLSLLLCIFAFCFAPLAYASDCGQSLDGAAQAPESEISPDDRAIRWLKDLLGPVTNWPVEDARAAVTRLLAGSRESPVSESAVSNNPDLYVHRQELTKFMQEILDPVAVGRALQEELDRREGTSQRRGETREDVEQDLNFRINFGEIPPATFPIKLRNRSYDIEKSYLIEFQRRIWMQLTPVTLWQLGEVLPYLRRDDRPANSPAGDLTWFEAQAFVDELNQWARTNDPRLRKVVTGHQPTWRYSLPTTWEWMYVASNLAANTNGHMDWREKSNLRELTLGGFTSMDQAAPYYRGRADPVNWEVGELDPMNIHGNAFHDFGRDIKTWMRPDPWGLIYPKYGDIRHHRGQTPGIVLKELYWFNANVLGKFSTPSMPTSEIWKDTSSVAPDTLVLGFRLMNSRYKHPNLGIRLIAFETDVETDVRLDPSTPVDETSTIARIGAAHLTFEIDEIAKSEDSFKIFIDHLNKIQNRTGLYHFVKRGLNELTMVIRNPEFDVDYMYSFQKNRRYLFSLLDPALKDWKQGRRNLELEKAFESHRDLMKILQHPALDLQRLAIEAEAQLKARGLTP